MTQINADVGDQQDSNRPVTAGAAVIGETMQAGMGFSRRLLAWHARHGRKDLPWQEPRSAYRVWVSEIMLQQTRVETVIPYYERFMERFADIRTLARASQDQVLHYWSGLGYYARARNLHAAARRIEEHHGGHFPQDFDAVLALPGIGRSTAGAILALAFGRHHAILDGNVKRVLARYYMVEGWPGRSSVEKRLWELAELDTPVEQVAAYTQAIMDLGATLCTRASPACGNCPLREDCGAHSHARQADFPARRPRRDLPVRETRMLLLINDRGEVAIERRQAHGIWGGLWSLPEVPADADLEAWCASMLGHTPASTEHWPVMRHTFSHFHLDITPVIAIAGESVSRVMDGDSRLWYQPGAREELGFAAPVVKLLGRLEKLRPTSIPADASSAGILLKTGVPPGL